MDVSTRCLDIARRLASGELPVTEGAIAILNLVHDRECSAMKQTGEHMVASIETGRADR